MEVINSRVRDSRSILLFGVEGQRKLRSTSVVVAGVGGLGSAVVEHLALLGVAQITTIDSEELDETNRNRFIGARASDPVPGTPKVLIADRLIKEIDPDVRSIPIKRSIVSAEAFEAVRNADWTIGCFDDDGPRAVLNDVTAAYGKSYIDLASDVPEPGIYGGRVCVSINGDGCIDCLSLLDRKAVRRYLESPEQRAAEDAIYGISAEALEEKGPSVSPINGVVAAIGAVEFMVAVTGLRRPTRLQEYRAHLSKVVVTTDEPRSGCPRCKGVWNTGSAADVERYLRLAHLTNQ
jgi:molybdopterin/thiamine biosynthesis adenylyltransferase